jgi:hypothetical protein
MRSPEVSRNIILREPTSVLHQNLQFAALSDPTRRKGFTQLPKQTSA